MTKRYEGKIRSSRQLAHLDLAGGVVVVRQYSCQDSLCSQTLHDLSLLIDREQQHIKIAMMQSGLKGKVVELHQFCNGLRGSLVSMVHNDLPLIGKVTETTQFWKLSQSSQGLSE